MFGAKSYLWYNFSSDEYNCVKKEINTQQSINFERISKDISMCYGLFTIHGDNKGRRKGESKGVPD